MSKQLLSDKGMIVQREELYQAVERFGGFDQVDRKRKWTQIRKSLFLPPSTSGGSRIKAIYKHYFLHVSVRSLSQPPIYGGRGHTQDIIDLLGGRGSSLVGTDGGVGSSSSSSSSSSLSSSSFSNYGKSSLKTGESAGEDDSNINQFWTAAQSSSQGAFASASSVSSSSSLTLSSSSPPTSTTATSEG